MILVKSKKPAEYTYFHKRLIRHVTNVAGGTKSRNPPLWYGVKFASLGFDISHEDWCESLRELHGAHKLRHI